MITLVIQRGRICGIEIQFEPSVRRCCQSGTRLGVKKNRTCRGGTVGASPVSR